MYTAIITPYRTAFVDETTTDWFILELFLDFLFIIDLFINFMSAIEISDEEVDMKFRNIAIAYVKSWFVLDLIGRSSVVCLMYIACIPFQLIELVIGGGGSGSYNKMLRLARLPRLYRLFRIFRLFKMGKYDT